MLKHGGLTDNASNSANTKTAKKKRKKNVHTHWYVQNDMQFLYDGSAIR